MKNICFILICFLVISCDYIDNPLPISFQDSVFEKCIRGNLSDNVGEYYEGEITLDLLEKQERLGCGGDVTTGHVIKDLSGIEFFKNLKTLIFSDQPFLSEANTHLIGELTELEAIIIENSEITDISFLKGLNNLEHIDLSSNLIEDISPIADLKNLYDIDLGYNNINDSSLWVFKDFEKLEYLTIYYNNIKDITHFKWLKSIVSLSIEGNQIESLEPLQNNPSLQRLYVEDNFIEDVSVLSTIPNLERVYLKGNCIEDFSSIPDGIVIYGDDEQDLARCE